MAKKIELLAPARNLATGITAINSGADAVYIGASNYGARQAAGNSVEEIGELVNYAHIFGAKVYVTLNTIIEEDDIANVEELITRLYEIGVDALIVQDFGIRAADIPLQRFLDAAVRVADPATELGELSARLVRDHLIRQDSAANLFLQITIRQKAIEGIVKHGGKQTVSVQVIAKQTG